MAKSTVPIELPGDPTADLHATTKGYVDLGLASKPGMPFIGPVPAGSTTPSINHALGTTDVDVTVYRVTDGVQVGVPVDRVDANSIQLTFSSAPTSGQYRVVVSAGTGAGGPGGGGGGTPDPHAASHATGGSDPLTPAAIGAATAGHTHDPAAHDHAGVYAAVVHAHNGLAPTGGATGQVLTKSSATNYDYGWQDPVGGGPPGESALKPYPPVNLSTYNYFDSGRNFTYTFCNTNAALGNHFRLDWATPTQDWYIRFTRPTNGVDGQIIMYELRTPAGGQSAGWLFAVLADTYSGHPAQSWLWGDVGYYNSSSPAGTVDYVTVIYDARASSGAGGWRVISITKGYPV